MAHANEVQSVVGPQLAALADLLEAQPPEGVDAPSLCAGWAVKHVVAHLTMPARYDPAAYGRELVAAEHDFERLSQTIARRDGELPFATLLGDLRSEVLPGWAPPGGGAVGALSHAVIHGLDVTAALGLDRTSDDQACRLVLDVLSGSGPFGVDTSGRLLRATDLEWQHGDGAVVEGTAADLILALANRPRPGIDLGKPAGAN